MTDSLDTEHFKVREKTFAASTLEEAQEEIDRLNTLIRALSVDVGRKGFVADFWLKATGGLRVVFVIPTLPDEQIPAVARPLMEAVGSGLAAEIKLSALLASVGDALASQIGEQAAKPDAAGGE